MVDATGQAHVEGEPDVTVYYGGVYPGRMPLTDALMWSLDLCRPEAFVKYVVTP